MTSQPELFPSAPQEPTPPEFDSAAIAEHIAANARPVEYADRTSEAARDQGHGPIEVPVPELAVSKKTNTTVPLELPGVFQETPQRGRSNSPGLASGVVMRGVSDKDRQAGARRAREAREALRQSVEAARFVVEESQDS